MSSRLLTKAEQDRQTVQNRYEKMQSDYAKGLTAFDKDLKARLEAAEQRRLDAIKQKVPLAHKCPAYGECRDCEEKQKKLKATMKAMSKAQPKAFKKKTLNRQLSRSADDVSLVMTEEHFAKDISRQYARGGGKETSVQKATKSVKLTVNNANGHDHDNIVTKVASSIAEWMGIKGKPAEPSAPAVSQAGTAKEAIRSTPAASSTGIVPAARDGYVKDTAAKYLQISDAQSSSSSSVTPKGSPSMTEVIMPRTLNGKMTVSMQQSANSRDTASSVVTKKGTAKDVVTASQKNQKVIRINMN